MDFAFNFHNGACIEYRGKSPDVSAIVEFIDRNTNRIVYKSEIGPNMWAKPNITYFVEWELKGYVEDVLKFHHVLDLSNKRVVIIFPYATLGDFLLWMPVFDKFRVIHNCHLVVHVRRLDFINIVHKSYPDIMFTNDYGPLVNDGLYAVYAPELYLHDIHFAKEYPKFTTPQQAASEFMGIKHETILPKIDSTDIRPDIDGKYVCITEFGSTNYEKCWIYPMGYQNVANYLVDKGYKVVPISFEPTNISGNGIIDKTRCSLKDMIQYIKYADLLIGGATGPMIVGLALGTPSIQISTNTWPDETLPMNYVYNHTEGTCFGCYTREPKGIGISCTKKHPVSWFPTWASVPECSMNITTEMVINKINEVLKIE